MSKAEVHPAGGTAFGRGLSGAAGLIPKILMASFETAGMVLDEASKALEGTGGSLKPAIFKDCCEIPETECPPRCVCEIDWEACQKATVRATIQVTNTSSHSAHFTFTAQPFEGPGNPGQVIQFSPASHDLSGGQSVVVDASLTVSDQFQPGADYETEMLIKGHYEQCICVHLHVEPQQTAHCRVEQGDPPVRTRAHRWYTHFQCTEECEPPKTIGKVAAVLGTVVRPIANA